MIWTQIRVKCKTEEIDTVSAIMCMVDNQLMIEDYSDIDETIKPMYGELIDENILGADKTHAYVSVFLPEEKPYTDALEQISTMCESEGLLCEIDIKKSDDEVWLNAWKAYYKPIHISERFVVVPAWESEPYVPKETEIIVRMDPGMAFGTGTHETTRLCAKMLDANIKDGMKVLDIGTGSGILAMFASKAGADSVIACDIDPVSVRVADDNIKSNGIDNIDCRVSDLLSAIKDIDGKFDLVLANIVSDILVRLSKDITRVLCKDALLITSGIINTCTDDVEKAMTEAGLTLVHREEENDWVSLVFKY